MDTFRLPHFDDTNFLYYKARMVCHLGVVDLGVWRVTRDGMKLIKNPDKPSKSEEKEIYFNARAKNCLFESFSMDEESSDDDQCSSSTSDLDEELIKFQLPYLK